MSASPALLVAGSANLDFVVRAPHIPAPGETVLGGAFTTFPGGKGANQAVACARAGAVATDMLVALGADAYGAELEASLRAAGVTPLIQRPAGLATGTAFICVSDDAENAITVAPGANAGLAPEHLPPLAGYSHLLLQLETPLASVTAYAQAARAAGLHVTLNGAPAQALTPQLLGALDLLIVNEGELAAITGIADDVDAAIDALAVPCVAVTLGARGVRARCDGTWHTQPGLSVEVVDTTAAGDTFCGALVAELGRGAGWPEALRFACAAAALACTRPGAQSSIPARADVLTFLQSR
jgi:ribokinase